MLNYLGSHSHLQSEYRLGSRPFKHVVSRLDSLLMVLKSCKRQECHEPWKTIHPTADIKTLTDALDSDYDAFYEEQPKVSFSSCEMGYLIDAEGPQHVNEWKTTDSKDSVLLQQGGGRQSFRYTGHESWWT